MIKNDLKNDKQMIKKNDKNIHKNMHKPSYGGFTSQPQLFPIHLAQWHPWDPDIVGQQGRVLRQHMDQAAEAYLALVNPGRFSWKMVQVPSGKHTKSY
jgi:hypothetical protein